MSQTIYRIDKFVVPEAVRDEFLRRIEETHLILRGCAGFVRDRIFEQCGGDGQFNLMTSVEWTGMEAMEAATDMVLAARKAMDFDPRKFMAGHGITADFGFYRVVA